VLSCVAIYQTRKYTAHCFAARVTTILLCVFPCISLCLPAQAMDGKKFDTFQKQFYASRAQDAAAAVAALRRSLQENISDFTPKQARLLYQPLALTYSKKLKDNATAMAVLDEALQHLAASPERFFLLETKAHILLNMDNSEAAQSLLDAEWPKIMASHQSPELVATYVAVLNRCGQDERALQVLQRVAVVEMQRLSSSPPPPHLKLLLDQLMAQNQPAQAESWAKICFMLCAYDELSLATTTQWLASAWMAKYGFPSKVAELSAALANPEVANPLREVKLPDLYAAVLKRGLESLKPPPQRMVVLLALGQDHEAMVAARALMLNQPLTNKGILEVCRVFKAHDLDLKRVNALLEYCKSGTGENPVLAFLKETEAK
jgi:hypothetical protein